MNRLLHIGLDVGSTTVKVVVMDENLNIIDMSYRRHFSDTKNTVCDVLTQLTRKIYRCRIYSCSYRFRSHECCKLFRATFYTRSCIL